MPKKKYYITTPIYYVNDVPHIGHAYTTLAADVIARYWREKLGEKNVFFLTGTDEHGQKVAQAAEKRGLSPKEFADKVSPRFKKAWELLDIKPDYFIRTTDPKHERVATNLLQKIYDNGYIKPGTYEGLYCVGCEKFLTKTELINGKCPLHPNKKPVYQKEKNYFLELGKLAKIVKEKIVSGEYEIEPPKRKHEVLSRLELAVENISISRAGVSWGIPVPWDKKQTIYVWVDALINYYSATKFVKGKEKFWPADLHIIGKDILWFHAVIWQALLIAAGVDDLPKTIFAHGFFTIDGQKMSKSIGNVISPKKLVSGYPGEYKADAARYLLLSAFRFGADGNISIEKFDEKYNADLANGIGNLVARIEKLAEKNKLDLTKLEIAPKTSDTVDQIGFEIQNLRFDKALEIIQRWISQLDKWLDKERPWKHSPTKANRKLGQIIVGTQGIKSIREIAQALKPFMPKTAGEIERRFDPKRKEFKSGKPLFPRLK